LEWRCHDEWIPDFQAGARPGSQPPTPGTEPQSVMSATVRAIRTNSEWFNYRPVR
jgi:hypothetical protein